MQSSSSNSVLAPAGAAATHLRDALMKAKKDFASQARKTNRSVSGDLSDARHDLQLAASNLASALDETAGRLRSSAEPYRDLLNRTNGYLSTMLGKLNSAAHSMTKEKSKSIPANAWARHPYLLIGAGVGAGYFILRAIRKRRAATAVTKGKSKHGANGRVTSNADSNGSSKNAEKGKSDSADLSSTMAH